MSSSGVARRVRNAPTPEAFLEPFPPHVRAAAEALRQIVKDAVPDVVEAVYPGWRLIGYRKRYAGSTRTKYFCFIAPFDDRVCLGFEYGAFLPDPDGLLEGAGRQVRQLVVRRTDEVDEPRIRRLVVEGARIADVPREVLRQG